LLEKNKLLSRLIISTLCFFTNVIFALTLEVNIHGLKKDLTELVKSDLTIVEAVDEPKLTKRRINNLYDLAETEIRSALEANGYYNAEIQQSIKDLNGHWVINFNIKTGIPVLISSTTFKITGPGTTNPKLNKEFHAALKKLEHGKTFTHNEYEDTKKSLLQSLGSYGYLKSKLIVARVELNRDSNLANIILEIDTGPRFKFGKVAFESTRFSDVLLRRYIPFKSDEYYDLAKIQKLQKNLDSSGFFTKIRIDTLPDFNNQIIDINVRLENRAFSKYTGSIGYGSDSGIRAGLGWSRVLESQPGHKIGANLKWSKIRTLANINYSIPGEQAADDRYIFSFTVQQEKLRGGRDSIKNEISATKQQRRNNTEVSYAINYFGERYRLAEREDIVFRKFLLPNFKFAWINEARNLKISILVKGASKYLASDESLISVDTDVKKVFTIGEDNKIILHTEMAGLKSRNFNNLPPSLRFYAGGDYSIRGFDYKSLGPTQRDNSGNLIVVGGKYLFTASIEYERRIYKEFGAAIFLDTGNAFNDLQHIPALARGVGVGVRYQTALGTIKADIARPLNYAKGIRIHFSFGADF